MIDNIYNGRHGHMEHDIQISTSFLCGNAGSPYSSGMWCQLCYTNSSLQSDGNKLLNQWDKRYCIVTEYSRSTICLLHRRGLVARKYLHQTLHYADTEWVMDSMPRRQVVTYTKYRTLSGLLVAIPSKVLSDAISLFL